MKYRILRCAVTKSIDKIVIILIGYVQDLVVYPAREGSEILRKYWDRIPQG